MKLDGVLFPSVSSLHIPFTLTWAHRNRLTQADVLVSHNGLSIAPEAGTSYTVRVLASDGVTLFRTISGIATTSWVYSKSMWFDDGSPVGIVIELLSNRVGVDSWQRYRIPIVLIPASGWGTRWGYKWGGAFALSQKTEITFGGAFAAGQFISVYLDGYPAVSYTTLAGDADIDGVATVIAALIHALPAYVATNIGGGVVEIIGFSSVDYITTVAINASSRIGLHSVEPAGYAGPGTRYQSIVSIGNIVTGTTEPIPAGTSFTLFVESPPGTSRGTATYTTTAVATKQDVLTGLTGSFNLGPLPAFGCSFSWSSGYYGYYGNFSGPIGVTNLVVGGYASDGFTLSNSVTYPGSLPIPADRPQTTVFRVLGDIRDGDEFTITLDIVSFTYTALSGDADVDVALALAALIDAHASYVASASADYITVQSLGPSATFGWSYAVVGPITASVVVTQAAV